MLPMLIETRAAGRSIVARLCIVRPDMVVRHPIHKPLRVRCLILPSVDFTARRAAFTTLMATQLSASPSPLRVAVVGAGIIGLSTALRLLHNHGGRQMHVTVIAEQFTPRTTSDVAGGLWQPYLMNDTPIERQKKWCKDTFDHLLAIAQSELSGDVGVSFISLFYMWQSKPINTSDLWYTEWLPCFRPVTSKEQQLLQNHKGYYMTSLMCENRFYAPWLTANIRRRGGQVEQRRVQRLDELYGHFDVVVNCTGFGARQLVNDTSLYARRGQLIRVAAPWVKFGLFNNDDHTCIFPGRDDCVVGIESENCDDLSVREELRERCLEKCARFVPSLRRAPIVADWVGLRPCRPSVRLESELAADGTLVVHNYGHGGSGITVHWGCAGEVVQLVNQHFATHNARL